MVHRERAISLITQGGEVLPYLHPGSQRRRHAAERARIGHGGRQPDRWWPRAAERAMPDQIPEWDNDQGLDEDDPGEVPTSFATKGVGWSGREEQEEEDDR